jgi:shikimate kinase
MTSRTDHIVVIGSMGAGKTTVGAGIAERLGLAFLDSDDQIREKTGGDGAGIAEADGVAALHELELQVFWEAFDSPVPAVIAAAASIIEDPAVREVLQGTRCVWVEADGEMLRSRRSSGSHRRPMTEEEAMRLARRDPLFAGCADVRIDTGSVNEHDAVSIAVEAITKRDQG